MSKYNTKINFINKMLILQTKRLNFFKYWKYQGIIVISFRHSSGVSKTTNKSTTASQTNIPIHEDYIGQISSWYNIFWLYWWKESRTEKIPQSSHRSRHNWCLQRVPPVRNTSTCVFNDFHMTDLSNSGIWWKMDLKSS